MKGVKKMIITKKIFPIADTYIDSHKPDENFGNSSTAWVGTMDSANEYKYLIKFNLDSIPFNAEILSCTLRLYIDFVQNENIEGIFTPYLIDSDWNYNTVTWNTQPMINGAVHSPGIAIGGIGMYSWDITNLFEEWFNGDSINYGALLMDDGQLNNDNKRLISSSYSSCAYGHCKPFVIVQYRLPSCCCSSFILGRKFREQLFDVTTTDNYQTTNGYNTSQQFNTTIFVKNVGLNPAEVFVEVSPNNIDYVVDGIVYEVAPGEIIPLVAMHFAKYVHLAYRSKVVGENTTLEVTIQSQV